VPPVSELEQKISLVFKEILNYDKVSIHDNFFELGGNSLKAQRTIAELKQRYGLELPILKLYQFPSIAQTAQFFESVKKPQFLYKASQEFNSQKARCSDHRDGLEISGS
jgi:acyl carrier protein